MRIVLGKKKRESVKDCYKTLHWLTVEQRIVFKVLLLTFKCLNDMGPVPLANLLVPKYSFDNYSSAIKLEECTFRAKTAHGRIQSLNVDYLETLSDHYPLLFNLCIDKAEPCDQPSPVMKRAIHKIDLIQFKADVYSSLSSGFENIAPSDFPSLCSAFTNSLAATLDVHAPLKKVNPRTSERPKWFDHEYILARAKRRRLEKHSKSTGIPDDRCAYVRQRNLCTHMARQK